jgi:hypothetical protein
MATTKRFGVREMSGLELSPLRVKQRARGMGIVVPGTEKTPSALTTTAGVTLSAGLEAVVHELTVAAAANAKERGAHTISVEDYHAAMGHGNLSPLFRLMSTEKPFLVPHAGPILSDALFDKSY